MKNTNQAIASEVFEPSLNEFYSQLYRELLVRLSNTLCINRVEIIKNEILRINGLGNEKSIDELKYLATLNVLVDLSQQGWVFDIKDGKLTLRMENENVDDKDRIRYRLSAERNAQFKCQSVAGFIKQMEAERQYKGEAISIRSLIGDKKVLIEAVKGNGKICEPYIQLVTSGKDSQTGYRLSDIWRYFRYTWSIPYKTMPGRNLFYLVRDKSQKYHPIIGIFALGNSVLNLTVRDNDIGWTVDAIKNKLSLKTEDSICEQIVGDTNGRVIKTKITKPIETNEEYLIRATAYADKIYPLLIKNIKDAIDEIYLKDLKYHRNTKYPTQEKIDELIEIAAEFAEKSINNKNNENSPVWKEEAQSNLFKRKRAAELANLLSTIRIFNSVKGESNLDRLKMLLSSDQGRKAIHTALIANRKRKIGSNMMEIIVCGSIPPYNELLGGKLVSILSCSPIVIRDYTEKYRNQISEIASRMKGSRVVRDSHLVFLGTTSLYAVGSSQYNRIKVPTSFGTILEYRKMGVTEGYGTVFFSKETTSIFSKLLQLQDGGKKISHVFGEGTSPRFRMISRGLSSIGIKAEAFLKHYSPRIVYSINLAKNTNEFLMGFDSEADYGYDLNNKTEVEEKTQELIDYWCERWMKKRLETVDIIQRLEQFDVERFLLGNI